MTESNGHIVFCSRMLGLQERTRAKASAVQPVIEKINVVSGRFPLAKAEDVNKRKDQRNRSDTEGCAERHPHRAEQEKQRDHERKDAAEDIPEQISIEAPRPSV